VVIPLTDIIKKGLTFFIRPNALVAFNKLKKLFIKALILVTFNSEKIIVIKIDILGFAIAAKLSQLNENKKLHSVVYFLRKMILYKRNYEIYNIKLLAIVEAFYE
jgi:hypothetical protein